MDIPVKNPEDLIERLKNADQQAFRYLVDHFRERVFRTALGLVQQPEDAEDIAQEVFLEVFRSVSRFRGDAQLSTWIYRITVNKAMNHIRRNKRHQLLESIESLFFNQNESRLKQPPGAARPDSPLENEELANALRSAMDSLPQRQRTAFVLHKYEEMPYQEIATVMGLSLPSVESLIHRAKRNLQKRLAHVDRYDR